VIGMLWLAASLIAAACIIELVGVFAKARARQLRHQETCREAFYRFSENLVNDPDTPEQVVNLVMLLAKSIESITFLWRFVGLLLAGKIRRRQWDSLEIYKELPQHLRSDYVGLLVSFVFSLTYNNAFLGEMIRRGILYSIPDNNDEDIGRVSPLGPMIDGFSHSHVHT
jgi:hypothetical protein